MIVSGEERFKLIQERLPVIQNNFTVIGKKDLDWLYTWAEFGITCYKMKKGEQDDLGEWRPSTDNRGIKEQANKDRNESSSSEKSSSGDVLGETRDGSGISMAGNMAEERGRQ